MHFKNEFGYGFILKDVEQSDGTLKTILRVTAVIPLDATHPDFNEEKRKILEREANEFGARNGVDGVELVRL